MRAPLVVALSLALGLGVGTAAAQGRLWTAVDEHMLEATRGGFDFGNGLTVSFGITRTVSLNGVVAASTSFNVSDLSRITPEQAALFNQQAAALNLVQNGLGNSAQLPHIEAGRPGTVIQNTLDNQQIQNQTIINATSNALGIIKGLNTLSSLKDALGNTIR